MEGLKTTQEASLVAQLVKNLPTMQETWVWSLGQEEGNGNPLQYSCLQNPWTEKPGGLQSRGSQESDTTYQLKPPASLKQVLFDQVAIPYCYRLWLLLLSTKFLTFALLIVLIFWQRRGKGNVVRDRWSVAINNHFSFSHSDPLIGIVNHGPCPRSRNLKVFFQVWLY